ncbi:MAG TPA: ABC transporter ATP-binding protein [Candidatus Obscuribacterales bacterium]
MNNFAVKAENPDTPWLEVLGLDYAIPGRKLLDGLDFSLESGCALGIVGPNGAGKSTLLRLLSGFLKPSSGTVRLSGSPVQALSAPERARLLAVVHPREEQPPFAMDVQTYLRLGRAPWQDWLGAWKAADQQALDAAVARTGITPLMSESLSDLSSGEWQRVQLARALTQTPRLLLLDEPTSHLDVAAQIQVMQLARTLSREGLALVCVIHDLNLAAQYMDRLLLLHQGRLLASGTPEEVLTPARLAEAYGLTLSVQTHPATGRPLLIPDYS